MFKLIIETAVRHRWLVVFMAALIAAVGLFQLGKLPIDAVPDITNRQVQINTVAPALTPEQIERQVTYPLETALAGIPGLTTTRSLSRNGFSQVTAIFTDDFVFHFRGPVAAQGDHQGLGGFLVGPLVMGTLIGWGGSPATNPWPFLVSAAWMIVSGLLLVFADDPVGRTRRARESPAEVPATGPGP